MEALYPTKSKAKEDNSLVCFFRDGIIEPTTAHVILITIGLVLCVAIVANLYTWTQMLQALLFSQRRHLQRAISHLDTLKSEGFLQALRSEVNLMTEMVSIHFHLYHL